MRYFLEFNNELDAVACDYFFLVDEKENIIERCNSNEKPIACGITFRLDQLVKIGLYDKKDLDYLKIEICEKDFLKNLIFLESLYHYIDIEGMKKILRTTKKNIKKI